MNAILNKKVNRGKLKTVKQMRLGNRRGIAIQDSHTVASNRPVRGQLGIGRGYDQGISRGRGQLESLQTTNKKPASKIPQATQNQSSHTNKTQFSLFLKTNPAWVISCSCFWKSYANTSHGWDAITPASSLSCKKIPTVSVFCKPGIYGKSVSQSWSFALLRAQAWRSPFSMYSDGNPSTWSSRIDKTMGKYQKSG